MEYYLAVPVVSSPHPRLVGFGRLYQTETVRGISETFVLGTAEPAQFGVESIRCVVTLVPETTTGEVGEKVGVFAKAGRNKRPVNHRVEWQ